MRKHMYGFFIPTNPLGVNIGGEERHSPYLSPLDLTLVRLREARRESLTPWVSLQRRLLVFRNKSYFPALTTLGLGITNANAIRLKGSLQLINYRLGSTKE
ncbi:hypothetical protein Adt_24882 [Abeliophyllum distichum]|uniref:Uncharacterized protein n=1 Tax=Abeliophyllum distichum TaxID=126358 RepID=A0ABD1SF09_9LAMI